MFAKVAIISSLFFAFAANCSNNGAGATSPRDSDRARPQVQSEGDEAPTNGATFHPAAHDYANYIPYLQGRRVGLVVNQTSTVGADHLVDALLEREVPVKIIFAPEHGFRGEADAGAKVENGLDVATGLPIKSLYGRNKKPSAADLADIDLILFDIQDVGARFYTYISTLLYVMESAARHGKQVVILDRPNPNGALVDGPLLEPAFTSFVGVAPIPVAHGLTVGEFAQMANGEGWLPDDLRANLLVIPMQNYRRTDSYDLPIPPSPNLPNQRSIYLYPHLCFFEGTALSVGRGTDKQFQIYGHPKLRYGGYTFTPQPGPGSANPKLEGQVCRGEDLTGTAPGALAGQTQLDLRYLLRAHGDLSGQGITFFTRPDFFDLLAGTDRLRLDIAAGKTEAEIRAAWAPGLAEFRARRGKYLLYP